MGESISVRSSDVKSMFDLNPSLVENEDTNFHVNNPDRLRPQPFFTPSHFPLINFVISDTWTKLVYCLKLYNWHRASNSSFTSVTLCDPVTSALIDQRDPVLSGLCWHVGVNIDETRRPLSTAS